MTTTTEPTTINLAVVRQALGRMPYGAAVALLPGAVKDTDTLVEWLNRLADTLQQISANHERDHADLVELQRQRSAVRAFLGTDVTA